MTSTNKGTVYVCFKRGDTFRGQLSAQSNVTYTTYGKGEKPVLTVSSENGADASKWTLMSGTTNIWEYATPLTDVGQIFFDGGKTYADKQLSKVQNEEYTVSLSELLKENLQFFSALPADSAATYNNSNASNVSGTLYLRCDEGNPADIYSSIEFAERPYVIFLPTGSENITIDNLCIKYGGAHGIGGGDIKNLTVQNCEVAYIGGGIQNYVANNGIYTPTRYGNGIEVNTACDGYTVKNCYIHDIYDAGITHQQGSNHNKNFCFENVLYTGNLIENCSYSIEYFARTSVSGYTSSMKNVTISDNIMRNAGSGFGFDRADGNYNMSAHIMGWFSNENLAENFVITNNIFDRSIKNNLIDGAKINSSLILVSAIDTDSLPDFEGNTYIHYDGSNFAYYGINNSNLTAGGFTIFSSEISVNDILGDTTGMVYLAK